MSDFLPRLLRAQALGAFKRGEVTLVTTTHARDCDGPNGGPCTCAPDITAEGSGGIQDVDAAGNPSRRHRRRS